MNSQFAFVVLVQLVAIVALLSDVQTIPTLIVDLESFWTRGEALTELVIYEALLTDLAHVRLSIEAFCAPWSAINADI